MKRAGINVKEQNDWRRRRRTTTIFPPGSNDVDGLNQLKVQKWAFISLIGLDEGTPLWGPVSTLI